MKCRRLLCFGMAAVLACAGLPGMAAPARELQATEDSVESVGVAGDYEYEELEDGTLEITGYVGDGAEIEIPSEIDGKSVTGIGYGAFRNCSGLTSITIPASVTSIGIYVFDGCSGLKSIQVAEENESYVSEDGVLYNKEKSNFTAAENAGYKAASKTVTLTVKPKKASLVSVKSKKKKTALVKWKRDAKASSYLIECATDKKFKKNKVKMAVSKNKTVSATVKKLKGGKKYYVRVCAYTKDGKNKIQGDWSRAKTVKVKK